MNNLEKHIRKLEESDQSHIDHAKKILCADNGNMYPLDFLFLGAINRSKYHLSAFVHLIKVKNYMAAAPMLRMQVDSILRICASTLVSDPHDFATRVLAGDAVRKMKDKTGNKMMDFYLLKTFKGRFPWIEGVYNEGSGFIHLSEKHILGTIENTDERMINMRISDEQDFIPELNYIEAVAAFQKSIDCLFELCDGWYFTKEHPEVVQAIMAENA